MRHIGISSTALVVLLMGLATASAEVLKREPPMGKLMPGQIVYVDDGSCPKGQIKKVTGGDHVKVGGRYHIERTRVCVAK